MWEPLRLIVTGAAALATVHVFCLDAHAQAASPPLPAEQRPTTRDAYNAALRDTLANPADPQVLARFASLAVQAGNLEGAISALERLLLVDGDLPDVKLELGVLYFRLGSFAAARGYLEGAKASPTASAPTVARASRYLGEIPQQ